MTIGTVRGVVSSAPWYRHRWPWILMAGPALVIVAGAVTTWLAIKSNDGLVADDYYKQGLAINQTLAREERARALGLSATVRVDEGRVEVLLNSRGAALPARIRVAISHPTRLGLDQRLALAGSRGIYAAMLSPLGPGRWQLEISDDASTWRLNGTLHVPNETEVRMAATEP